MDAGGYETNTLLISQVSDISFRIYEPIASQSSTYTFNASDVEDALRSDGHLVYMDAVRRGIWCFYLSSRDSTAATSPERLGLHPRMEVCGYPLGLVAEGNLEPIGLLRNKPPGTNAINTPSSSSSTGSALDVGMRSAQSFSFPPPPLVVDGKVASTPVGDVKGYGSVPAREIHEFFITAVLSSLTTYFCRAVGAILLNHRSALLPSHAFNSGDAEWSQPTRSAALATFRTYLTTTGSLVISLHVSVLQGLVSSADVLRSSLLHAGPTVLAAPFGTFGALQGIVDTETQAADGGFGQTPDTQLNGLSHPQANGYSPMALWRSSNGGPQPAAGAVYPTPPDVVQPVGVTPSFEGGTVQSPAGQPGTNAQVGAQAAVQQNAPPSDGFHVGWDGAEPRPGQPANNFSEENIFGDLGEDMFEGNELTDADFNFFDEQPAAVEMDVPLLPDIHPSGLAGSEDRNQNFDELAQAAPGAKETKDVVRSGSPHFTKPELKHARSTLEERRQQTNMESFNLNSTLGIKRNPSPSNLGSVLKRFRGSICPPPTSLPNNPQRPARRRSIFEKVDFDPALSLVRRKYEDEGPFAYRSSGLKDMEKGFSPTGSPLTRNRLPGFSRQRRNLKELPSDIGSILAKLAGNTSSNSPTQPDYGRSDSDDSSWASDSDDASDRVGRASSPAKSSVVRRRPDDDVTSMAASFRELDNISTDSPAYGPVDFSRLSNSEIPEFPLAKYFADPEPVPLRVSISDDDFITVAQILTEQAAGGFLRLFPQRPSSETQDVRRSLIKAIRYSIKGLQKALPRSLAGAAGCQLRPFAEVQDVPLLVQPNGRVQMRPADFPKPGIFSIPAPHVELRRYDTQLSVLPSAVSFWDTLGLAPAQGPKDVVGLCVLPQSESMRDNASAFLDRVKSTYESMRLGTFERLPPAGDIADGVVLLSTDPEIASPGLNLPPARSAYTDRMASLAVALASSPVSGKNIVVYFAYTPENPGSIVDLCSAFQELLEQYKRCMSDRKKKVANQLVLQLVPVDAVASETFLVVLSPSECARLCIETYDRCTLFGGPTPVAAIVLERALPRGIDFKLAATPSPSLLRENSCMHIAYARSVDERWIAAAWTDNRGSTQTTAAYCLGRRGKPLSRQLAEVIHEMWETTYDLISSCKVHWRLVITKCGPMDQHEMELWSGMAQAENRATISLVLLTVDTDPSLQLIPPAGTIPQSAPSAFYTTPASTPQPLSGVSPDQSGNNPSTPIGTTTPGGDNNPTTTTSSSSQPQSHAQPAPDPDAPDTTLVDATETTWGVVVSHRLNNSASLTDLNPALASGYLVKRTGARAEDAPVAMEVNVVFSDNARALYDGLLREMLTYFRGLGTLARVRGVVERDVDVRPWHVAVVEKAVRALYLLM
ncbi:9582ef9d-1e2b-42bf-8032-bf32c05e215b [Thermothielavioides terrestris]|uniref:Mediator of RNA polymerase II transcription subunit 13 n=1 Tax=Thermothielavioides terrestris TaxID=2587410 RepID=A0A446BL35_9PEZI|nr:9582ef9d-1e2b-42bf-8032-bf32c05e215b [Thermothielavioides terrestris]